MGRSPSESLSAIRDGTDEAVAVASRAVVVLAGVADLLELPEVARELRSIESEMHSDTFAIIVVGRFNSGKSTLVNALLGGVPVAGFDGNSGPMVVDDLPATARLTAIHYADQADVKARHLDGTVEGWSIGQYQRQSTLDIDDEENQRRFGEIEQFEMGLPAPVCRAGVTLYDSPGLDENSVRTLLTRDAAAQCDAAVVLYRSDVLMGHTELMDVAELVAGGTHVFTVVNLFGDRDVDDKLRGYVWNRHQRIEDDLATWAGQDLASRDIYFVNAARALTAVRSGDEEGLRRSGLPELEARLSQFLIHDRQRVHMERFVRRAVEVSEVMSAQIHQRRQAAEVDQRRTSEAYAVALPRLRDVRQRPARILGIVERHRDEAQSALLASLRRAVGRIREDLPAHLDATPLPSGESFTKVLRQRNLREEAARTISAFVVQRMDQWSTTEATAELEPILERLGNDISHEVAMIHRELEGINLELAVTPVNGDVVTRPERVFAAVAGLLLGGVTGAVSGGAGGLRGVAGNFAGSLGAAYLLGALGVTSTPLVVPVMLAAGLVVGMAGGGVGFEKRIKREAFEQADPMICGIPDDLAPLVAERVSERFAAIGAEVANDVREAVDIETRNIERMVELGRRSQRDRDQLIIELFGHAESVAECRAVLRALSDA